jgi:predicted acyltransferase
MQYFALLNPIAAYLDKDCANQPVSGLPQPEKNQHLSKNDCFMPTATSMPAATLTGFSASGPMNRLLSLDFMRGLIMVLLMLESAGLYSHLNHYAEGTAWQLLIIQFEHHPWHGLRAWDLVQPGFMFMAGTALALSLHKQQQQGVPWKQSFKKALKRSGWLFFWGVTDYAVRPHGLSFELWDVLTQLSFTLLVAFLLFRLPVGVQLAVSIGLLLLTEVLYRGVKVPGFDQPFTDQHNFGNYADTLLMHKINPGGWVAINCLPTAAHTIWGAVTGKLLLEALPGRVKLQRMVVAALLCLLCGYLLDLLGITPIIKRIATSSFVLVSGGYCILLLALCYWWIDIRQHRSGLLFFQVVGMNAIFIYLFFEIVGDRWFNGYITSIVAGLLQLAHMPVFVQDLLSSLCIFALEWGLCYFLYRKKIFFRL